MRISPIKAKSGCDNRADSRRRCQVDNRWMLMAENSISGVTQQTQYRRRHAL